MTANPVTIAVMMRSYESNYLAAVEGINAYRDRHHLDWDLRITNVHECKRIPARCLVGPSGCL